MKYLTSYKSAAYVGTLILTSSLSLGGISKAVYGTYSISKGLSYIVTSIKSGIWSVNTETELSLNYAGYEKILTKITEIQFGKIEKGYSGKFTTDANTFIETLTYIRKTKTCFSEVQLCLGAESIASLSAICRKEGRAEIKLIAKEQLEIKVLGSDRRFYIGAYRDGELTILSLNVPDHLRPFSIFNKDESYPRLPQTANNYLTKHCDTGSMCLQAIGPFWNVNNSNFGCGDFNLEFGDRVEISSSSGRSIALYISSK
ncbi:hypothetical protein [Ekhidna sp.]|uniref:hypothetical protein n=1 Tax=Ekhidna sp. TaxID=2608089 RepID=UPI003299B2A4